MPIILDFIPVRLNLDVGRPGHLFLLLNFPQSARDLEFLLRDVVVFVLNMDLGVAGLQIRVALFKVLNYRFFLFRVWLRNTGFELSLSFLLSE